MINFPAFISKRSNVTNELPAGREGSVPKSSKRNAKKNKGKPSRRQNIHRRDANRNASNIFNHIRNLTPVSCKCSPYESSDEVSINTEPARVLFPTIEIYNNDEDDCRMENESYPNVDKSLSNHASRQNQAAIQQLQSGIQESKQSDSIDHLLDCTISPEAFSDFSSDEVSIAFSPSMTFKQTSDNQSNESLDYNWTLGLDWDAKSISQDCVANSGMEDSVERSRLLTQFELIAELGRGAFGLVLKVLDAIDQQQYALKIVPLTEDMDEFAMREPRVHARLTPHPNLCRYIGVWREEMTQTIREAISKISSGSAVIGDADKVLIIQQELYDMNLKKYLKHVRPGVDEVTSLNIFRDMLAGVAQLHRGPRVIMHRDLKPSNVFLKISNNGRILKASIGDFGLSTDTGKGDVGTPTYGAPEQTAGKDRYDEKVDVYSLGLILFELFHPPWTTEMERSRDISEVKKGRIPDSIRIRFPRIAGLIESCVAIQPWKRPTATELYDIVSEQLTTHHGESEVIVDDHERDRLSLLREVRMLRKILVERYAGEQ